MSSELIIIDPDAVIRHANAMERLSGDIEEALAAVQGIDLSAAPSD